MKSFRLRIVLWYTIVATATLLVFRFATVQVIQDLLYEEIDASLEGEMRWIKGMLTTHKARNLPDDEIREEILVRSRLSPRKEFIEIYDVEGEEYFRSPNLDQEDTLRVIMETASPDSFAIMQFRSHELRMIVSRDSVLEVYIGYPLTDIDAALANILSSFVVLIPGAAILLIGGGLFLATRFVKPIKELRIYARKLVDQPLDEELKEVSVRTMDEVGLLVEQVNHMVYRMRSSMRQVLGFSTLASHELRTPLTVIRNELEEALQEGTSTDDLQAALVSTYDEVLRLNRIVDDLLSLATMQAGTFRLELSPTRVDSLLEEFCDEALVICREKNIMVVRDFPQRIETALDTERFRYVLFNLLDNAVKHTPEGGTIRVAARSDEGRITIKFADSGRGIPKDQLRTIFDPFRRVNRDRARTPGSGLGLALVRWIVEAHRGTVHVERSDSNGTVFSISLPTARESELRHS